MQTEIQLQSKCFQYAWNYHPETRGHLCYNLNNSRNVIDGNQNKAQGLIKGRSDMTFYWNLSAYFLEFKTETGVQSNEQKQWQSKMEDAGYEYHIIRTEDQFKEILTKILSL